MAISQTLQPGHPQVKADLRVGEPLGKKIWIDLDNSPHIPFFSPIIKELEARGGDVILTARDAYQVTELVDLFGLDCYRVGKHYGKNKFLKVFGVLDRALRLVPLLLREKPDLALSHGSRAQMLAAYLLRIPCIAIMDYEFAHQGLLWVNPTWVICPAVIPDEAVKLSKDHILRYRGIKEDVYVPCFKSDPATRAKLGLTDVDLVVTIRPPATEAHYHRPESDVLFRGVIDYLAEQPDVKMVVLPRNSRQDASLRETWPQLIASRKVIIPEQVLDGMNLIWHSDLVVSGGGTMNREAAALGVPVYSIFRSQIGKVDQYLTDTGRLILLEDVADARKKLKLQRRSRPAEPEDKERQAMTDIVDEIASVLKTQPATRRRDR
jgi:predicted glycosyltransferase